MKTTDNSRGQKIGEIDNERLASFSIPESHYVFKGPPFVQIKSTVKGEKSYCKLDADSWSWKYAGDRTSIHWIKLYLDDNLKEILKAFVFNRLQRVSPKTVESADIRWINFLQDSEYRVGFPWASKEIILALLAEVGKYEGAFYGFKAFYKFGSAQGISGFTNEFNEIIQETRMPPKPSNGYRKILLQEINKLSPAEECVLLDFLHEPISIEDYYRYRDNVLLHLAFELSPRPIQLHALSSEDLESVDSASGTKQYFSLWLPMAKKLNTFDVEKRYRQITPGLGAKMVVLLDENKRLYGSADNLPIFIDPWKAKRRGAIEGRLSTSAISKVICNILQHRGFKKGDGATLLRHHLAQSLAD